MNNYFEHKLTYNQIFFNYTNKAEIDEREIHTYNEILFYYGDDITFLTETFSRQIKKNTLIFIPKEKYHYFDNSNIVALPRLKIAFPDIDEFTHLISSLSEIRIIDTLDDTFWFAFNKICSALENGNDEISAIGAFYILLAEIAKSDSTITEKNNSHIISECVEYIGQNLKTAISIKELSKKLNVSESALTHTFKKEMGISVHKYIQQKRLIFAKNLIEKGEKPSKIYFDCGYSDYSAFYKAYCKMFCHPPSDK